MSSTLGSARSPMIVQCYPMLKSLQFFMTAWCVASDLWPAAPSLASGMKNTAIPSNLIFVLSGFLTHYRYRHIFNLDPSLKGKRTAVDNVGPMNSTIGPVFRGATEVELISIAPSHALGEANTSDSPSSPPVPFLASIWGAGSNGAVFSPTGPPRSHYPSSPSFFAKDQTQKSLQGTPAADGRTAQDAERQSNRLRLIADSLLAMMPELNYGALQRYMTERLLPFAPLLIIIPILLSVALLSSLYHGETFPTSLSGFLLAALFLIPLTPGAAGRPFLISQLPLAQSLVYVWLLYPFALLALGACHAAITNSLVALLGTSPRVQERLTRLATAALFISLALFTAVSLLLPYSLFPLLRLPYFLCGVLVCALSQRKSAFTSLSPLRVPSSSSSRGPAGTMIGIPVENTIPPFPYQNSAVGGRLDRKLSQQDDETLETQHRILLTMRARYFGEIILPVCQRLLLGLTTDLLFAAVVMVSFYDAKFAPAWLVTAMERFSTLEVANVAVLFFLPLMFMLSLPGFRLDGHTSVAHSESNSAQTATLAHPSLVELSRAAGPVSVEPSHIDLISLDTPSTGPSTPPTTTAGSTVLSENEGVLGKSIRSERLEPEFEAGTRSYRNSTLYNIGSPSTAKNFFDQRPLSIMHAILTQKPVLAVFPGRSADVLSLTYSLVVRCFASSTRQEIARGSGQLFLVLIFLLLAIPFDSKVMQPFKCWLYVNRTGQCPPLSIHDYCLEDEKEAANCGKTVAGLKADAVHRTCVKHMAGAPSLRPVSPTSWGRWLAYVFVQPVSDSV